MELGNIENIYQQRILRLEGKLGELVTEVRMASLTDCT